MKYLLRLLIKLVAIQLYLMINLLNFEFTVFLSINIKDKEMIIIKNKICMKNLLLGSFLP